MIQFVHSISMEKKRKYTILYPQLTRFRLFKIKTVILTYNVSKYRLDTFFESSALLAPVADPAGVVSGKKSLVLKAGYSMAIKTRSTKRNFCSSGEGESSDSDTCFSERWNDHLDVLNTVAYSRQGRRAHS